MYVFIAITPKSTWIRSCDMGQLDLFENYSDLIGPCVTFPTP